MCSSENRSMLVKRYESPSSADQLSRRSVQTGPVGVRSLGGLQNPVRRTNDPKGRRGQVGRRDLARLQCMLISLIGTSEGNAAQEQLEGQSRIAATLRMFRDAQQDAADRVVASWEIPAWDPVLELALAVAPGRHP